MKRFEAMREKDKAKKAMEIEKFMNNINVLHKNLDNIVVPSVEIMIETEKCYINYYISQYPYCLTYSLTYHKKDYPFNIYYSKEFYKNGIPAKYKKQFDELEQYFINRKV